MNPLLQSALSLTYNQLGQFSSSDNFWQVFDTTFSTQYNRSIAEILGLQWQAGDFTQLPKIELISSDILGNANGAYASSTNKIYLSDSFVTTATPAEVSAVLLEEIGHFVDSQINLTDSAGDEGEIFATLVQGKSLNAANLQTLKTENDHATITVNSQSIEVEQNTSFLNLGNSNNNVSQPTLNLASLGLKVLTNPIQVGSGLTLIATGPDPSQLKIRTPFNQNAATTTRTDKLWTGGGLGLNLTGAGITVGVWDEGPILSTHQELTGRVRVVDAGIASNHSTHVAGTIGATGVVSAARGMANQVRIRSRDWINDFTELNDDADLIQLSNHSYSDATGWDKRLVTAGAALPTPTSWWTDDPSKFSLEDPDFGRYSTDTQALDNVLYNNKALLSVWAAGNDRDDKFTVGVNGNLYVAYLSVGTVGTTFVATPGWYLIDPAASGLAAPPQDGNAGAGYDSLPTVQTAKNSLVVGAISDTTWTGSNTIATGGAMLGFSNWGMTDDGRVKVDLVANGDSLYSSIATSNTAYYADSGTSMAAPNVTGTMALLYEHHNNLDALDDSEYENVFNITNTSTKPRFINIAKPSSATMKGLAIHTATDLGRVGPDYEYGWGLLNGQSAATFLNDLKNPYTNNRSLLAEDTFVGSPKNIGKVNSSGGDVRITLIWTDPAPATVPARGVNNATIDNSTSVLVNDLDLYLEDSLGNTYYPWTLNPANPVLPAVKTAANHRDNIEQVVFNATTEGIGAGDYTVYVGGSLASGYTSQDFSIFFSSVPQFGKGHAWGDVHLNTFDSNVNGTYASNYNFQAVGEFILVESTVDDWQIQTRQEPLLNSATVSVNTAFATNIDGYKVVFDIDNASDNKIKIDGTGLTLASGQSQIFNTSKIERQGNTYTFTWAGLDGNLNTSDDDRVTADDYGDSINISVEPADYRTTFVRGLLGNGDGDVSNDFTLRNGTLLSPNPTVQQIHTQWADSWRISQEESLFGTQTFSNPNFPKEYVSLENLPLATVNAAKIAAFRAGLPVGSILDGAALDFAVTGDEDFIKGALLTFADIIIPANQRGTLITLDIAPTTVTEDGTTNLVYTFTRTGSTNNALTAKYKVGGTATFKNDYTQIGAASFTGTTGTITFAAGSSTAKLTIDPIADTIIESNETVGVTLATGTDYKIGTTKAVSGTIVNDGITINLSANQTIVEGRTNPQTATYTVTLSNTSSKIITVKYATANGTAISGLDYTSTAGTLTFNPGIKTQVINIPILNNFINEANETFTLTLTSPTNAILGAKTVTTTITDTLIASVTTTLPANVENLTLAGTAAINGTGNAGNNVITGNKANNTQSGLNGNDTLKGEGDDDSLYGGDGNDLLYGGSGKDYLKGDNGDDKLYGDADNDALYGGDGNDYLNGGGGNDTLDGGSGNDTLDGGTDSDAMYGGSGDDIYYVDRKDNDEFNYDTVVEYAAQGIDTVFSSVGSYYLDYHVENLTLIGTALNGYGNDLNNIIKGNSSNNYLSGGVGDDFLSGGTGNDILTGGSGADKFYFYSKLDGIDTIKDFKFTEGDKIQVSKIGFGVADLTKFTYDSATGALFFQAQHFATIENKPAGFAVSLDVQLV